MKVIYVTGESYIDHSYTIAREMKKHIDFPVFMHAKEETEEISRWCGSLGAEFVKRKRFRNPFSVFSGLAFILRLRKMKADLVWFNSLSIYHVFFAWLLIRKMIVTVHDVEKHPDVEQFHAALSLKLTFWLLKKKICVVSDTQAAIFSERFGFNAKVFRLPIIDYFTESGKAYGKPAAAGSIFPERKDGKRPVRFLFFGSVEAYKGIELLLDALKILRDKQLECELGIFGKLKYDETQIKEEIAALGNVTLVDRFIDYSEVHSIYSAADVLVLPYRQVTQCGPLLIAYNELMPVICSNKAGFIEYVVDNESGLIFDPGAEDLAEKMEAFITHPELAGKMKNYIGSYIFERFSMQRLADIYIANFAAVCGKN